MSFAPVVPLGGYAGWKFLERTLAAQQAAFAATPRQSSDAAYFREKIGTVGTAADLVADRRLLSVALGAFGLSDDLGNRAFIRRVLEDGTLDPKALANRLSDKRYAELSRAFGFGDYATPRTRLSDFADRILARYADRGFEAALGESNGDMRLALNARRELAEIAAGSGSDDAKWYRILSSPPLRSVLQTAFGLPGQFAAIDLDQQIGVLRERAAALLGSGDAAGFADPPATERLIQLFLIRSDTAGSAAITPGSAALALLTAG